MQVSGRFGMLWCVSNRFLDGAVLVYDITDEQSFQKVRTWVRELRRIVGDDIQICIAGNKVMQWICRPKSVVNRSFVG